MKLTETNNPPYVAPRPSKTALIPYLPGSRPHPDGTWGVAPVLALSPGDIADSKPIIMRDLNSLPRPI